MDCIFCKIISKEVSAKILYEDDDTISFLDAEFRSMWSNAVPNTAMCFSEGEFSITSLFIAVVALVTTTV